MGNTYEIGLYCIIVFYFVIPAETIKKDNIPYLCTRNVIRIININDTVDTTMKFGVVNTLLRFICRKINTACPEYVSAEKKDI